MRTVACVAVAVSLGACFKARPSKGGGQISAKDTYEASREPADPADIEVPPGYRVELVADDLTFPTGVTFGPRGEVIVVESGYTVGDKVATPKILAFDNGARRELVVGPAHNNGAPWNGITFADGALYVAQGGQLDGGRIARYDYAKLGEPTLLVENLPSLGDHHTNAPIVRDGWVYFGQGTATNSAVVGVDNHEYGWLARHPEFHDTPCEDVTLVGTNFTSPNPLTEADDEVTTGAYLPFGTPSTRGQVIRGKLPCNGAVMRVRTTGGPLELVAWGFRNPYGLAFAPDGTLYVADNGHDTRGSRPVFGSADMLWKVERGRWYGWPDFSEGRPLTAGWYSEDAGDTKGFVLAEHPGKPPDPVIYFPVHSSADGLDFSTSDAFGHVGDGFVALFGDQAPAVGKVLHPVGFAVMKVDPATGELEYFARNRPDRPGPASKREARGLERPIAARFDREGKALYIVDFGIVQMTDKGPNPIEKSGRVWRIVKEAARASR